jgi:hypothetical protein
MKKKVTMKQIYLCLLSVQLLSLVQSTMVGSQSPYPIAPIFAKQIGSYVIKTSSAATKYCAKHDIKNYISDASIQADHDRLSAHFRRGRQQLLNGEYFSWLMANALTYGLLFVFVILS